MAADREQQLEGRAPEAGRRAGRRAGRALISALGEREGEQDRFEAREPQAVLPPAVDTMLAAGCARGRSVRRRCPDHVAAARRGAPC